MITRSHVAAIGLTGFSPPGMVAPNRSAILPRDGREASCPLPPKIGTLLRDFLTAIDRHPAAMTTIVSPSAVQR